MAKFAPCNRDQPYLLPPDMRDWIPADALAHFVIEAVELVDVSQLRVNERGTGSAQYEPHMVLVLLIYCYAIGIFSSRRIERATWRDLGVRFVAANRHPDHDTIAKFRRENFAAVANCFLQVLLLAKELKLLRLGTVSVDGTRLKASASKHRSVTYQRAGSWRRSWNWRSRSCYGRRRQPTARRPLPRCPHADCTTRIGLDQSRLISRSGASPVHSSRSCLVAMTPILSDQS